MLAKPMWMLLGGFTVRDEPWYVRPVLWDLPVAVIDQITWQPAAH